MKEELESLILTKSKEIGKLNLDMDNYKNKLKGLTFNEYSIEDYVISIALEMKRTKEQINLLEKEVYELMQILKASK